MRKIIYSIIICFLASNVFAQSNSDFQQVYLGPGCGFDYGGLIGAKIEYLPIKQIGLFGGVGYNLLNAGWNIGASYKIPTRTVTPDITLMYGYNAVIYGSDSYAKQYEATSYGVTVGAGLDFNVGRRGNKISTKLFLPFRSSSFRDTHDRMKADPNIKATELVPVGFSIGFNFAL